MSATNPGGRLWVDSDGVYGVGDAYDGQVQLYDTYLQQLTALRARYANAWGDDDMGTQFSTKFLDGLDNLEAIIGGVKGTLAYTAEGLRSAGKAYEEADEEAAGVGTKMAKNFEQLNQPAYETAQQAPEGQILSPVENGETPRLRRMERLLEPGERLLQAGERRLAGEAVEGEPGRPLMARTMAVSRLAPTESHAFVRSSRAPDEEPETQTGHTVTRLARTEAKLLPAENGTPLQPLLPAERIPASELQQAMPATSTQYMRPAYATAYVGGQPLPEGFKLVSLNPFADGNTRVDANLYDSITPLSSASVTNPDGTPIDVGDGQLFVVKENPTVDPTAPGYRPLVLSYSPDGTPTPIYTG